MPPTPTFKVAEVFWPKKAELLDKIPELVRLTKVHTGLQSEEEALGHIMKVWEELRQLFVSQQTQVRDIEVCVISPPFAFLP